MDRTTARARETRPVEGPPGIHRTTIAYNDALMLCHFHLEKGVEIPFHSHAAVQNGYLISGRLVLKWPSGRQFIAEPGSGWCFASNEMHGAAALEECEAIECFNPARPEYVPQQVQAEGGS
jgi:quercetin dioxygenase-like cupin family protein